jgi:hypothetical protein
MALTISLLFSSPPLLILATPTSLGELCAGSGRALETGSCDIPDGNAPNQLNRLPLPIFLKKLFSKHFISLHDFSFLICSNLKNLQKSNK